VARDRYPRYCTGICSVILDLFPTAIDAFLLAAHRYPVLVHPVGNPRDPWRASMGSELRLWMQGCAGECVGEFCTGRIPRDRRKP